MLLKITMLFTVTFVIYGFISNATTSQNIALGNCIVKNIWKILYLFHTFQINKSNQINNLVLVSLMANPKKSYKKTK